MLTKPVTARDLLPDIDDRARALAEEFARMIQSAMKSSV
jgi:hypothetical protein